jgi:1,4-dihydroxy-2-naphthoyl-CoA hydrolase
LYTYQTKIKLHETDAAGLLFFSNQLKLMHDAYESLLETLGVGFAELLRNKNYFLPIVHAEADYKQPLFVGDVIEIQVTVESVGTTSFTFAYQIFGNKENLVGTGKTVHVTIDKKTGKKTPLPPEMRSKIEALYKEDQ